MTGPIAVPSPGRHDTGPGDTGQPEKDEAVAIDSVVHEFSTAVAVRTDRAFARLMIVQWAFSVALAFWYTPRTWIGAHSTVNPTLLLALFYGGVISLVPAAMASIEPGCRLTRHIIAAGQMLMSALIIHLLGGRIESHFHIFGSLAFLAFYLDWTVLLTATAIIVTDHFLRGMFWPESIFGTIAAQPWRSLEHAGWVVFCDLFLINSCLDRLRNLRLFAAQQVAQRALLHQAYTDLLTGLPNRLHFQKELARRIGEEPGAPFALMYIDLDHFKEVNDMLGHAAGDHALQAIGKRMAGVLPEGALVSRVGGDEFVALMPAHMTEAGVAGVAETLLTSMLLPLIIDGRPTNLGASIGVSCYPEHGATEDRLLKCADSAMYRMKKQGRLGFVFYDPLLDARESEAKRGRDEAEEQLRQAIKEDEFVVYYQPLTDTNGRVASAEALVRWMSPTRGQIMPGDFIPLAESSKLIVPLGQLVLEKVCAQAAAWRHAGVQFGSIAVNISPQHLERPEFIEELLATLGRHSVTGTEISLEVTESAFADSPDLLEARVRALREQGIRVSLDDFGTGYSSLARLQQMPFDVVKVDRMFVSRLGESKTSYQVLETIIMLAHLLEMQVVAEGVETEEQYRLLRVLGCNNIQGFFVSRPLPADAMREFIDKAHRADGNRSTEEAAHLGAGLVRLVDVDPARAALPAALLHNGAAGPDSRRGAR